MQLLVTAPCRIEHRNSQNAADVRFQNRQSTVHIFIPLATPTVTGKEKSETNASQSTPQWLAAQPALPRQVKWPLINKDDFRTQIQSHHSHPSISVLVTDNWAHWIQTPLTYLQSSHNHQRSYLHNLITFQPPRSTRSSSLVILARPSTSSSLRITDRSFQYASSRL